ncbi:MAG: hypothetical protein J1E97_02005 [Muribaculaceae bacterium]|nr:hypothetical protein [Muribaculaceae bacterium]
MEKKQRRRNGAGLRPAPGTNIEDGGMEARGGFKNLGEVIVELKIVCKFAIRRKIGFLEMRKFPPMQMCIALNGRGLH